MLTYLFKNYNIQRNIKVNPDDFFEDILRLLQIIKYHHYPTHQHSLNVCKLCFMLAKSLGLTQKEIFVISLGGLLHDLGKIIINPAVLNRSSKLLEGEWRLIKKHPFVCADFLLRFPWGQRIANIVLYHHERIDGGGYIGLKGDKIPFGAKIITIADAFDAMFSYRAYSLPKSIDTCIDEIIRNSGTQFEPELIKPFLLVLKEQYKETNNTPCELIAYN
ncbi:MAG: hypothetical protein PWP31_1618 [Clostridia bacterium]|nr:hypothetical protein [Clostridia bacterium]